MDFSRLAAGGEVIERRVETIDDHTVETQLRRIPPQPRFYLHLGYGDTEMPVFRRPDGEVIPYAVEPSGIEEFPFVLTLAIDQGRIASTGYGLDQYVVEDVAPITRSVEVEAYIADDLWQWRFDSDAALFRIGDSYTSSVSNLWLHEGERVVAIYADGREEVLLASRPEPSSTPWWLAFALPLPLWWIGHRAARSLVAEV